ncbi:Glycoside hydrolase/PKD [Candidatus Sulfotelmatobacter kueseliae]|uniref:Glycoside hydrolase/PKD n=1 Tax=Candidatus Sulfotelmatobacter kueseliae TaxID=2042962 RepID=A0A2U3L2U3_9BACT|nr:Glycoside hydrolase/PKD [Candidatus Sulfotelmatobacter kueseliae]
MIAQRWHKLVFSASLAVITLSISAVCQTASSLQNKWLAVSVRRSDGSFEVRAEGLRDPVLSARVGAETNHKWIFSNEYSKHEVSESDFHDALGEGRQVTVSFIGVKGKPNLRYVLQLYNDRPYGGVKVQIENTEGQPLKIQSIRMIDAVGSPRVNLGGPEDADRVLSDSYSEDRPPLQIFDLGKAPVYLGRDEYGRDLSNLHLAVGSQLIYNRQSKVSLLLAALSSDRWLTIMHLRTASPGTAHISSYTVDSTGTTEIMKKESIRDDPASDQIELSVPLPPGKTISSEKLTFSVSKDYHAQLENYGEAIRLLNKARIPATAPWGWWSWTAYYFGLSQGTAVTNAEWLSEHFKDLGFDYFHIDEGYAYDDGEFLTPNATSWPDGLQSFGRHVCHLGLKFGMWVAPFRVGQKAWVYEKHKDWLVHNSQGKPIQIGFIDSSRGPIYVLDPTHPGAQEYLRRTFEILSRDWGARYFKLDFMDDTAIEGYRYRPDVTALGAQRMGLQIIRDAVGDDVLLDKDGSPMLNAVGLTELGRISADTGHSFAGTKEDAVGIAARYYMNNNFYAADPDAFTVARQLITDQIWRQSKTPLTLDEAEVSITLAAIAGGMFELGDDLPTLAADPDRVNLVRNRDLLEMVRLRRAAKPLDLMTYLPEDEQPSVFLLHEDKRQSMLVVFNWTESFRSHEFTVSELGMKENDSLVASDVLHQDRSVNFAQGTLRINDQTPHSVRVIKIVDNSIAPSNPVVKLEAPSHAQLGVPVHVSCVVDTSSVPVLAYNWDFGDGVSSQGPSADHAYTRNGVYKILLKVEGINAVSATQATSITILGTTQTTYDAEHSRRYKER